jgi:hypothetical protein
LHVFWDRPPSFRVVTGQRVYIGMGFALPERQCVLNLTCHCQDTMGGGQEAPFGAYRAPGLPAGARR